MKTIGTLYVDKIEYWHKHFWPIVEVGHTQETTRPYRQGHCLVFRLPWTHPGYVIGMWVGSDVHPDDDDAVDDALAKAMRINSDWEFNTEEIGSW